MAGPTGVESSYLVQGLNTNERKLFLNYFREESHSAGSYIFKENDAGDTLLTTRLHLKAPRRGANAKPTWIFQGVQPL